MLDELRTSYDNAMTYVDDWKNMRIARDKAYADLDADLDAA